MARRPFRVDLLALGRARGGAAGVAGCGARGGGL